MSKDGSGNRDIELDQDKWKWDVLDLVEKGRVRSQGIGMGQIT